MTATRLLGCRAILCQKAGTGGLQARWQLCIAGVCVSMVTWPLIRFAFIVISSVKDPESSSTNRYLKVAGLDAMHLASIARSAMSQFQHALVVLWKRSRPPARSLCHRPRGPAQLANGQPRPVIFACNSALSVHVAHSSLKMSLHYVETSEEESCLVIARFIGDVLDGEKVSRQHKSFLQHIYRASTVLQKSLLIY